MSIGYILEHKEIIDKVMFPNHYNLINSHALQLSAGELSCAQFHKDVSSLYTEKKKNTALKVAKLLTAGSDA